MQPVGVLCLAWLLLICCMAGTHARKLHQTPEPVAAQASPAATNTTGADLEPVNATKPNIDPATIQAPEQVNATKPKINPATVQAFLDYANNCTCNRRPKVEEIEYTVTGPLTYRVDGASTPGPRTTVRVPTGISWQSVCSGLTGALCTKKYVKCGRQTEFTDDSGKVNAVGNDCAARIDYF